MRTSLLNICTLVLATALPTAVVGKQPTTPKVKPELPQGLVDLYDLSADKPRATLRGHPLGITSLAFSPDGKTLATGSYDKTVVLWNVATGKRQTRIPMLSGLVVWALAYAPDGKTLAIATCLRDFALPRAR